MDRKLKFDKFRNKYSLMLGQKMTSLVLLPPQEIRKDQEYVQHQHRKKQQMDYEAKNNKELQHTVVETNGRSEDDNEKEDS